MDVLGLLKPATWYRRDLDHEEIGTGAHDCAVLADGVHRITTPMRDAEDAIRGLPAGLLGLPGRRTGAGNMTRQEARVTANAQGPLAQLFEARRARLEAVAYRLLGCSSDAEDAVQEAWLRLSRSDSDELRNFDAWLTTVVGRISLSMLRARRSRHELIDERLPEIAGEGNETLDPEREALLADSVGMAMDVILNTLSPAERVSFVLHDLFDVPFEAIAPIIERSPVATRQLASRARRRVQGVETPSRTDAKRRHEVVAAFLTASRGGDLETLLTVLDPDVTLRADPHAVRLGAAPQAFGTDAARFLLGRAGGAQLALVNGVTGAIWVRGGRPLVVFSFEIVDNLITRIDLTGEAEPIERMQLQILP
jgi:RNA polymerase sigma-70 factor (ECF subfamily)